MTRVDQNMISEKGKNDYVVLSSEPNAIDFRIAPGDHLAFSPTNFVCRNAYKSLSHSALMAVCKLQPQRNQ